MAQRGNKGQRSYNMVMLAVTITVMNIMVAAALPLWSAAVKRDREEELIFRGLQYAEAIRVYQTRKGALPTQLKDLLEQKPRSIRQLWTNPMSKSGNWGVLIQAGPGAPGQPPGQQPPRQPPPAGGGNRPEGPGIQPGQQGQPGPNACLPLSEETPVRGPIRGVCVPNGEDTFKSFFGATNSGEWVFSVDILQGNQLGGDPNLGAPSVINAETLGRPFPPGIQLPGTQGSGALGGGPGGPGGRPPGGPGGQPPRGPGGQPPGDQTGQELGGGS